MKVIVKENALHANLKTVEEKVYQRQQLERKYNSNALPLFADTKRAKLARLMIDLAGSQSVRTAKDVFRFIQKHSIPIAVTLTDTQAVLSRFYNSENSPINVVKIGKWIVIKGLSDKPIPKVLKPNYNRTEKTCRKPEIRRRDIASEIQ